MRCGAFSYILVRFGAAKYLKTGEVRIFPRPVTPEATSSSFVVPAKFSNNDNFLSETVWILVIWNRPSDIGLT